MLASLKAESKSDIIEQLASKNVEKKPSEQMASAETVKVSEGAAQPVNENVLSDLVKPHESAKPVPVIKDRQPDEQTEKVQQINKNILDELTGGSEARKEQRKQSR